MSTSFFSENVTIIKPTVAVYCQHLTLTSNISNMWHFAFITSAFDPHTFTCGSVNQHEVNAHYMIPI